MYFDRYQMFLIGAVLFIFIIGLQITPGTGPDSVIRYLPISEEIATNDITWYFYDNSYETAVGPPLYFFLSALLIKAGMTATSACGLISLISFALLPVPLFYLSKEIGGSLLGVITVILCIIIRPFFYYGTMALSEMLFVFLTISSLCLFIRYLNRGSNHYLIFSTAFLILACYTRYLGLALFVSYICLLLIRLRGKLISIRNFALWFTFTLPFVLLYQIRNCLINVDIYPADKIPFSLVSIFVNCGMIFLNTIWDFIGFSNEKSLNQTLMDYYFSNLSGIVTIDYLYIIKEIIILYPHQILSLAIAAIIVGLIFILIILNFKLEVESVIHYLYKKYPLLSILLLYDLLYLGMYLYTGCTMHLALMDTRYLLPLYPSFIIFGLIFLFEVSQSRPEYNRYSKVCLTIILTLFILWHCFGTFTYLSSVHDGRGFSDPEVMNGETFNWLYQNPDKLEYVILNEGFIGKFWEKSLNHSFEYMPHRNYPPDKYLDEIINNNSETYLVISKPIDTKDFYRWNDLKPYIQNSSSWKIIVENDNEKIVKLIIDSTR